ncbi:MAG: hypothetical protein JW909_05710 [Planctomycetes bacterium]|nr:hypothetical protein [Planctomycetota bacterium]
MNEPLLEEQHKKTGSRIVKASGIVMLAHGLLKILGLVQASVLGSVYGVKSVEMDVFSTTFTGIIMAIFLVGEEALGPAFLPLFMEGKDKDDEKGAWKFASTIISLQTILLILVIAAVILFPGWFVELITKWSDQGGPEAAAKISTASRMLRIMAPGLLGLSIASTTYMVLNGYKKFFLAAFGDGTLKIFILLGVAVPLLVHKLGGDPGKTGLVFLAIGVLAGSWGKLATHVVGLGRKIRLFRPAIAWKDPAFKRFLLLVAPLLIGIIFAKVRDSFNNYWVLSDLEKGIIAANDFGKKIYNTLGFLAPYAVSIAMFPFFCEMIDRNDKKILGETVTKSLRVILFLLLPMSAGVMIISIPVARIIYQHGNATYEGAVMAGTANAAYILGLAFWAGEMILMQAFFSSRRTIAPVVVGLIWSFVSMLVSYIGIVSLKHTGITALVIVAGGFAFARAAKTITLALILRRDIPVFAGRASFVYLLKLILVTLGVAAAIYATKRGYEAALGIQDGGADLTKGMKLMALMGGEVAAGAFVGLVSLIAISLILHMEEVPLVYRWARARLAGRSSS